MLKRVAWLASVALLVSTAGWAQSTVKAKRPIKINSIDDLNLNVHITRVPLKLEQIQLDTGIEVGRCFGEIAKTL